MYICHECSVEYPQINVNRSMMGGDCELHGHLKGRWGKPSGYWARNVRRPVIERDPVKYIKDQLFEIDINKNRCCSVFVRRCTNCREDVVPALVSDYHYKESGYPRVYLTGITIYGCLTCEAEYTSFPSMGRLHDLMEELLAEDRERELHLVCRKSETRKGWEWAVKQT